MAKANSIVSMVKDAAKGAVTVTVQGFGPITVNLAKLAEAVKQEAIVHGIGQKLVDAAALGAGSTPREKFDAISDVAETLASGQWNSDREGGATSLLFEAVTLWQPKMEPEAIREILKGMSDTEKRALPFDPEVAPFYKQARDARDAKKGAGVDTSGLKAKFKQ